MTQRIASLVLIFFSGAAVAGVIQPYDGKGTGGAAALHGSGAYYFGTYLDHVDGPFWTTFASPISAPAPLEYCGLNGYFVATRDDLTPNDVLGWFDVWPAHADFGNDAQPNAAQALHPVEWSLQPEVTDDQELPVYFGRWQFIGGELPLGSGLAGGSVWGTDPNDLFGVLSNPNSSLEASVYTNDLDNPNYTSLAVIPPEDGGVPAWSPEFNVNAVPEPSSLALMLSGVGIGWWRCRRRNRFGKQSEVAC